ncbi:MAG TPA: hypothetical protein VFB81_13765 [Myxococcales bacterium]|nr:hypothetical protein [Myxococcales bacterium]
MRSSLSLLQACLLLLPLCLASAACKDAETVAAEQKQESLQRHIADGRMALDRQQWDTAASEFKSAAEISPQDPMPLQLLSSAYRQSGNIPAALLSLKQASALMKFKDPAIRKQMSDLEKENGNVKDAVRTLQALLEEGSSTGTRRWSWRACRRARATARAPTRRWTASSPRPRTTRWPRWWRWRSSWWRATRRWRSSSSTR